MENNSKKLDELVRRLEEISKKHEFFSEEIRKIRLEIQQLKSEQTMVEAQSNPQTIIETPPEVQEVKPKIIYEHRVETPPKPKQPSDLEKIIGESWINKIGILILVIGVAIGTKYSIENNLISPLTRIVLGYLSGVALLGCGIKLKEKFESYSAVLVSGAMSIFYFITYFAYDFYELLPQLVAFGLMMIFTGFTVFAALQYNRSVIAHIGLVGAYAIPFLLSNDSGNVTALFSYITIINLGILVVAMKRYWKSLYYIAFSITWLIFAFWMIADYSVTKHKLIGSVFALIFFLMFYAVAITNRILQEQRLALRDMVLILMNSFIYYGFGYVVLNSGNTETYLGLFTLFNAAIHFGVGYFIRNKKVVDKNLFYLVLGLVFCFITIAIPVQLEGNWVTLLWIVQSVLLFWIGRTKQVVVYEKISYIIMCLVFMSLLEDWVGFYSYDMIEKRPLLNIVFFTSLLVLAGYGYIVYLSRQKKYFTEANQNSLSNTMSYVIGAFLGIVGYFTFQNEISLYFDNWFEGSAVKVPNSNSYSGYYNQHNYFIRSLEIIFLTVYSLMYFGILSLLNISKIRNRTLGLIIISFTVIALLVSQSVGLFTLGNLREAYLLRDNNSYFEIGLGYILIRYILFGSIAFAIYSIFRYIRQEFITSYNRQLKFFAEFLLYISILSFMSNELITWLDLAGNKGVFKLGLSILWGVYSLVLILLGIKKGRKYLRIGGIVLFAITLLKLFFYDISHLNTISKTIVFISLGGLLLVISFLYNKFKDQISEDEKED